MGKKLTFLTLLIFCLGLTATTAVQAQEQEEKSAATLYNEGLEAMKAKDYANALPLMEMAIEKADPNEETGAQVIKLAKRNGAIAAYYTGNDKRKAEEHEAALELFDKGIAFNEDFYANYIGRAQALDKMGNDLEAVKAYIVAADKAAAAKKDDRVDQLVRQAEIIVAKTSAADNFDAAIEQGEALLALKETAEGNYYTGQAYESKGDASKGLELVAKAIELAGEGSEELDKYYMFKGNCHEKLGQKSEAIDAYKMITSGKYFERAKYNINKLESGR